MMKIASSASDKTILIEIFCISICKSRAKTIIMMDHYLTLVIKDFPKSQIKE